MSTPPPDDPSGVTQGGRTPRLGRSAWWIAMVAVVGVVVAAFVLTSRRPSAPAEQGTAPLSGSVSGVAPPAAGRKG